MQTKKQKLSFLSYFSVSVVIFLVISGTVFVTGAFFQAVQSIGGTITLGGIDFQILNNFDTIATFENNLLMPDETIDNGLTILNARDELGQNIEGLSDILIKVKPILKINDINMQPFLHIELANPSVWIYGDDGFLYCTQKLAPGQSLQINNYFVLSYLIDNSMQDMPVLLAMEVQALQVNLQAILDFWTQAPEEWINIIVDAYI